MASASFADTVVTNSWIYHADEAYASGRWCSWLYKDAWSCASEPTADQIVEFSPGAESMGIKNSLTLLYREEPAAEAKGKEHLAFSNYKFYAKGLVIRPNTSASDAYLVNIYFSGYGGYYPFELQLGSEGVRVYGDGTDESAYTMPALSEALPLRLTASQTWKIGSAKWQQIGLNWTSIACNLAAGADVTWRILGKGNLYFARAKTSGSGWIGTSEDFAGKVFANATVMLDGASQVNRLGTNAVEFTCATVDGERAFPGLMFRFVDGDTSWEPVAFAAPLTVTATDSTVYDVKSGSYGGFAIASEEKDGRRAWISFPKGIRGTYGNNGFLFAGEQTGADGIGVYPGRRYACQMRRDVVRFVLDGDNSDLVPLAASDRIRVSTLVTPAHANALGAGNAAKIELLRPTVWNGEAIGLVGVIASNGVTVAGTIGTSGAWASSYESVAGAHPSVIVGSEGPGVTRFTGDVNVVRTDATETLNEPTLCVNAILTADKGGTAAFDGVFRAGRYVTVNGTGDVALNNGGNVIPKALGIAVRSGRLIAGATGAVGNGPIAVGEAAARYTVRAVKTGRFPRDGTVTVTVSADDGATPTKVTFTSAPTVDGVTLAKGDRVLVASQNYITASTILDGVFTVTDDTAKTWELDPAFDTAAGRLGLYGARIHVTEGTLFAGRDFYWAEHLADRTTKPTTLGSNKFAIYDDAAENPDTGLLAAGGVTLANDVTVANDGTGTAELGACSAGEAVFTGVISVRKPTLVIHAPEGATVQFSNLIKNDTGGTLTIVKTGAGKAVLNQLDKSVTDIRIREGTLKFAYVDTEATQPLLHLDAMDDSSLTKVEETVDETTVTSVTMWADTRGSSYPYVRSCRDQWLQISPVPESGWAWNIPRHGKDWHYLLSQRNPVYSVTNELGKTGFDLPSVNLLDARSYNGSTGVEDPLDFESNAAALDIYHDGATIPYQDKDDSPFKHVREAFAVVKDNAGGNMSLLGTTDSSNREYYRRGSSGLIVTSAAESDENRSGAVKNGTNRLDGVEIDVTATPLPGGFHVVSFCPTGDTTVATLGLQTSRHEGGIQYGEVIVYTNALSKTEHDRIEAELLAKWLGAALPGGDAPATLETLTIGVAFTNGNSIGSLDLGARFKPSQPCVVNVTRDASRIRAGDYLLLRAKSVETDGSDWTVNKVGFTDPRRYQIVRKSDGNLYLRIVRSGAAVFVR